ncbi:unnamed protein product [Vitrella brassicaformis CCMP3155]|uniref:EF-hand domain-containing protein n=1 Tax=Vitrella brassicaformis (strain CCMP3155) TaxID=1169540 RepID=A0A0G4FGB9_VITBC|nr:unnamed protein product [Vitrella brassicaformis CCMP3155]|mmetsp:Transcript_4419/g.10171  ORF Transcript_4419/g.10171 Transcript_4419/m.10171 type:complete len:230 (-) Transcript_4419:1636-2325(-)|eukprot:CEM12109.1 unnamed protein product [Vitrella brassicaformis CCMP3155]
MKRLLARILPAAQHSVAKAPSLAPKGSQVLTRRTYQQIPIQSDTYWATSGALRLEKKTPSYDDSAIQEWKDQFPHLKDYSAADLMEWRRAFDSFDVDNDGFISQADLQKDPSFTVEKIHLLKEYDRDKNALIDFGEFVEAMMAIDMTSLRDSFAGFDPSDVILEFDRYSVTPDGSQRGRRITLDGVKHVMREHDFSVVCDHDARKLFSHMDINGDNEIDFEDFKQWLKH